MKGNWGVYRCNLYCGFCGFEVSTVLEGSSFLGYDTLSLD